MFALLQSLRIEKGLIHNHHDCYPMLTPMECGLAFTVDFKKENGFYGMDELSKRKKIRKRLVSFILPTDVTPHGHYTDIIYRKSDNKKVGYLASTGYSHMLDAPIGLGFVDVKDKPADIKLKPYIENEHEYEIELVHKATVKRVPVKVSFSCVVDPKGNRLKGNYENL